MAHADAKPRRGRKVRAAAWNALLEDEFQRHLNDTVVARLLAVIAADVVGYLAEVR